MPTWFWLIQNMQEFAFSQTLCHFKLLKVVKYSVISIILQVCFSLASEFKLCFTGSFHLVLLSTNFNERKVGTKALLFAPLHTNSIINSPYV